MEPWIEVLTTTTWYRVNIQQELVKLNLNALLCSVRFQKYFISLFI